jgi:predicted TPR repeat methyltransferase
MGNHAFAREAYETACKAAPHYVQARVLLGVTLLATGEHDAAVAAWKDALSIEPENRSAKMYLRMAEAQHAGRPSERPSARSEPPAGDGGSFGSAH